MNSAVSRRWLALRLITISNALTCYCNYWVSQRTHVTTSQLKRCFLFVLISRFFIILFTCSPLPRLPDSSKVRASEKPPLGCVQRSVSECICPISPGEREKRENEILSFLWRRLNIFQFEGLQKISNSSSPPFHSSPCSVTVAGVA